MMNGSEVILDICSNIIQKSDMGQNQSKKEPEGEQSDHERLGHIKLEVNPLEPRADEEDQESYIMHLKRSVENDRVYNDWLKSMNQINDSESKEVILLPLKHSFEPIGMCGSSGIARLTFDYYEFVLRTEILNRNRLKKDFLETEVWYLLYNIVRAGSKFQHLKKKIGNVHPQNILINESGQIKIISTVSLPGEITNYDYLLQHQNQSNVTVYLAPEQINNDLIQKGNYPSHVDPSLAEVFSIGLTILSSGTLEDCDSVYKTAPYELKKDRLNALLKVFKEKYSDYLYQTVAGMLAFNPQQRKRCSSIAAALYEHQQKILDLEPFEVPMAPQQRPSYGYQRPSYQQPPQQVTNQPLYYQPQAPNRATYQVPSNVQYPSQQVFSSGFGGQPGTAIYHRSQM